MPSEYSSMKAKYAIRRQILSCICGNIITVAHGGTNTWSSANFVALQSIDSTFPGGALSVHEAAMVLSIYYVGAMVGNFTAPFIVRKFGCKRVILALAIPQIIICLLIAYGQSPYYLYASSIIGGLVGASNRLAMQLFAAEISSDEIRGTLNAFYDTAYNLGSVIGFLLAAVSDSMAQVKVQLILPVIFLISFAGIPATPQHLCNQKKEIAANRANKFFKGTELEIAAVSEECDVQDSSQVELSDFTNKRARSAILIAFSFMLLYPLQGTAILNNYVTEIMSSTKSNISPLYASTIITAIMIGANLLYLNIVDRFGRRTLYMWSTLATAIGLTLFALHLYLLTDNRAFDWVPVVCLSYISFVNSLGMYPIPWLIIVETMPNKIKPYIFSCCVLLTMISGFIFTEIYPLLKAHIGLFGWVTVFGTTSFFSVVYGFVMLPETRGKSHEEIMRLLD